MNSTCVNVIGGVGCRMLNDPTHKFFHVKKFSNQCDRSPAFHKIK